MEEERKEESSRGMWRRTKKRGQQKIRGKREQDGRMDERSGVS